MKGQHIYKVNCHEIKWIPVKIDSHGYMCSGSGLSFLGKRKIIALLNDKQLKEYLYKTLRNEDIS